MTTPWRVIQDRLVADGAMSEQGVTRTPKARHCAGCGRVVIAAITDCGFEVAVDPYPLTPRGELEAAIADVDIFAVLDHGEMVRRDKHRIAFKDANNESAHPCHECGRGILFEAHPMPEKRKRDEHGDEIPF